MRQQSMTEVMSTEELVLNLQDGCCGDEGKMSWRDCLVTLLQVASAIGFCLMLNFLAT